MKDKKSIKINKNKVLSDYNYLKSKDLEKITKDQIEFFMKKNHITLKQTQLKL